MQLGINSLTLLRKYNEAGMHFMSWRNRERVVRAGFMSGDFTNKAERLGFSLIPADKLGRTKLIEEADIAFETTVLEEIHGMSHEFAPFVLDVAAVHGDVDASERNPILFIKEYEFATTRQAWRFRR